MVALIPISILLLQQIRQDARRAKSLQEAEDSGMESGVDEAVVKDTLWVEKYKPKHYLDLLSDEVCLLFIEIPV